MPCECHRIDKDHSGTVEFKELLFSSGGLKFSLPGLNMKPSMPDFGMKPSMPDFDMPSMGSMPGMSKMSSFIGSEPDKAVEEQVKLEVSKMDVATKQNRLDKITHTAFTRFLIHM